MAKIDSIEHRLLNWARWKMRSGGMLNYAGIDYSAVSSSSGYREAVIPIVDCEADETEAAIQQLPAHLRDTLAAHYTGAFVDVPAQARVLGCSVSTVHARISDAHRRLFAHFEMKRQAAQAEVTRLAELRGHPVVRKKEFYEL